MKLLRIQVLAVALCLAAFTSPSFAQRGGGDGPKKPGADSITSPFQGKVVSATAESVRVKGGSAQPAGGGGRGTQAAQPAAARSVSFAVTSGTKILRDGQPISAAQLKQDEPVQVVFITKQGSSVHHATEIQAGTQPAKPAPGARVPAR